MTLRTRLNLVLTGLTAMFVAVLLADQLRDARSSVREEIEAANRVAAHLLGRLAINYSATGGLGAVHGLLTRLGHVRANEITLRGAAGELLYQSPPAIYKAGREAPQWFRGCSRRRRRARCSSCPAAPSSRSRRNPRAPSSMPGTTSRACSPWPTLMLVVIGGLAFWLVDRALAPFPVIVGGLERLERGELSFRLPALRGAEAHAIGAAFNRMAQAVEDKVQAERNAREARTRLEERRELAQLVEQTRGGGAAPDRARAARRVRAVGDGDPLARDRDRHAVGRAGPGRRRRA